MEYVPIYILPVDSVLCAIPMTDLHLQPGCLLVCGPLAPEWPAYAACLAACTAAGTEGDAPIPDELTEIIKQQGAAWNFGN